MAESSESAVFLKSAYTRILDEYFDRASFFKPTGDGLLVVLDYDEGTLTEVVNQAVKVSIQLVDAFPTICADDPMVNFDVPGALGIGLSRGAATRLRSGDATLDYSGRPLNLAARLMDLARPSGVVFSDSLGVELLEPQIAAKFANDDVYIKGLAEDLPMRVHYSADRTVLSDASKRPINKTRVHAEKERKHTVRELEGMGNFRFPLTEDPIDRTKIRLLIEHPDPLPSGGKRKGVLASISRRAVYGETARGSFASINLADLARDLREKGLKGTWDCTLRIEYAIADVSGSTLSSARTGRRMRAVTAEVLISRRAVSRSAHQVLTTDRLAVAVDPDMPATIDSDQATDLIASCLLPANHAPPAA